MESRRVDNQARGRSGRQGDEGNSIFFVSLEDDLMRIFGSESMNNILEKLGLKDGESIDHPWINKALERAQQKVEARNFDIRKTLLKFDNVLNDQRQVIFSQRNNVMESKEANVFADDFIDENLNELKILKSKKLANPTSDDFTKSFKNHRLIENLGVEPLSREFNKDYLFEICRIKNISIKKLIMDQKVVVGVGNIYASESLFLSKIKPNRLSKTISLKECDQLTNAIKRVLRYAIRKGGTTLKDFYSADGSEGYFNLNLNVYDRKDENCKNCKSKIKKVTIGQRASFFCDSCQN